MTGPLLAKSTGETIAQHTVACLEAARALISSLPLDEEVRRSLEVDVLLAVAMHDVGKAASGFQRVLLRKQKNWRGRRHEVLSAALASSVPGLREAVIFAILTHHRSLPPDGTTATGAGCLPWEQIPAMGGATQLWQEMADEWRENRHRLLAQWLEICAVLGRADLAAVLPELGELTLGSGWLDRSTGKYGQRRSIPFVQRHYASLVRGLTVAADHLGSAHSVPPSVPDLKAFPVLRQTPRPFQEHAGATDGSALLRAPTGSGKTEAALLWAQRNHHPNGRLFYVLPYTASINAMYSRLGPGQTSEPHKPGIFGAEQVGLLHSQATAALYAMLESEDDSGSKLDRQERARELSTLAREMWFPIRVCTPHQLLRYMLRGRRWETMLAEFPRGCFVFDEIHAYDSRVVGLTLGMARRLADWGVRSLFVSATLPRFLEDLVREVLGPIPLIAPSRSKLRDKEVLDLKRHAVVIREGSLLDNLQGIVDAACSSASTLVVCNHVKTAQVLYEILCARLSATIAVKDDDLVLLHGRFNQEDRNRIEAGVMASPLPRLLVATQVVEVSLNVDFERAFLEPAPVDALAQRMGRVNRFGLREPAEVVVLTEQVNPYFLYCDCKSETHDPTCHVWRSIEELRRIASPLSEGDLVDAADRVYEGGYKGKDRQAFDEGLGHPDISRFEERLLAGAHQGWVENVIESTDGTVHVLPRSLLAEYDDRQRAGLWVEAAALLVPVREKSLRWLRGEYDDRAEVWVVDYPYGKTTGLVLG